MNPVTAAKNKAADVKSKAGVLVWKGRDLWAEALKDENARYFAAVGFVPFIGWMVPLYLKKEDRFCQSHGRAAFYMALSVLAAVLFFMLINIFTPRDYRIFRLVLVGIVYFFYLLYVIFISYGVSTALKGKDFGILEKIPVLNKLNTIIEL